MSYNASNSNNFGDYQLGEGFSSAVNGEISDIAKRAPIGADHLPAGLQGLGNYTAYPSSLSNFPQYKDDFNIEDADDEADDPSEVLLESTGLKGYENYTDSHALELGGFRGVEDDAFAGFTLGNSMKSISEAAQSAALDEDEDLSLDGYGTLSGMPEESFHTFFHRASMATTDTDLIKQLAKAVKTVDKNMTKDLRKQYYELSKEMLLRRKTTNLKHLDMQRAEIESNIGWLINPDLPKTGGFNAVLKKAVGAVGAALAKNDKVGKKSQQEMKVGRELKNRLRKTNQLHGFGSFVSSNKATYLGLALAGAAAAGLACYIYRSNSPQTSKKRRRK